MSLSNVEKRLARIEKNLMRNTLSLEEHMKRSAANEEAVKILRDEIKPIQAHIYRIDGGLKLVGLAGVLVGLASGVLKMLGVI